MNGGTLVVGSINLDMVVRSPRIPGPGENICGTEFRMVPGGKGANQAVAAGRLGTRTFLLGSVGADFFGDFLVENLEACGVDPSLVRRAEVTTGVALIVVERNTGVNTIVVDPGANMALAVDDLEAIEPFYDKVDTALFQLEIPVEVVREGARRAKRHGVRTVLDAGPPRGVDASVLSDFDVVSPNRDELADLTGTTVSDISTAVEAARELVRGGVGTVVAKMAEAGALLVTAEGAWHFPPYRVTAVDATAAGDAFTAGLAVAMGEGMAREDVIRFANAAGAVAVTVLGAQPSMPRRAQVERLMASQEVEGKRL